MSSSTYQNGLFIFHRDFRIRDNIGLLETCKQCKRVYTCFVFTPEQVSDKNKYRSQNAIQFMIESLVELQEIIQNAGGTLITLYSSPASAIEYLTDELSIDFVGFNRDYTPYALKRDKQVLQLCEKKEIECIDYEDYYLYPPGTVTTGSGTPYKKYTPFYDAVLKRKVQPVSKSTRLSLASTTQSFKNAISLQTAFHKYASKNTDILVHGGRTNALLKLKNGLREQKEYDDTRDFFINKTTHLSAYIKFGCVSIREVYHTFVKKYGINHGLIRELIWREFFAHVLYGYPEVVGKSYQPRFQKLKWENERSMFNKWKSGNTGFPIVDACMRELNETGYMHNRGRMTVASFLIKTLLIDWRWGEQYFAQQLTDYDLASNNGNWQGISGTGVDMKPYFRDMNPWIQSSKFDKNAEYIKKWVPELENVDATDIHNWHKKETRDKYNKKTYVIPMVEYTKQKENMLKMYENA